jgi:16S rRNA G1207 methylase RsmC
VSGEHYFSSEPAKEKTLRSVSYEVAGTRFDLQAASGTFSQGGLDKGTRVLLSLHENFPKSGTVLDLGCGWGPIATTIARLSPDTQVVAVDVNSRSLELTNLNASTYSLTNLKTYLESELPRDIRFDEIWSNPPIRIGKSSLHSLLKKYISLLKPAGRALLVVQKQLGAESLSNWLGKEHPDHSVKRILSEKGYWVIEVTSPRSH